MPTTMTKAQRKKTRDAFAALAASLPEPPTSRLATTVAAAPSGRALRAARLLVGAVDPTSVNEVAASLESLMMQVAALQPTRSGGTRNPRRKPNDGRG